MRTLAGAAALTLCAHALWAGSGPLALVGVTSSRTVVTINPNTGAISNSPQIGSDDRLFYNALTADSQGRLLSIPTLRQGNGPDSGTGDQVVAISPINGATTVVATLPQRLPDIFGVAAGPNDLLYISSRTQAFDPQSPFRLYTFDMTSGVLTTLVTYSSTERLVSIEFGPGGTLWGWEGTTQSAPGLVTLDPLTGLTTDPFPAVGGIFNNILAIGFGPDGRLFGGANRDSGLYEISTTTGAASLIAADVADIRGLATVQLPSPGAGALLTLGWIMGAGRRRRERL